jgi:hypothetical protein
VRTATETTKRGERRKEESKGTSEANRFRGSEKEVTVARLAQHPHPFVSSGTAEERRREVEGASAQEKI